MSPNPALLTWPRPVAGGGGSFTPTYLGTKFIENNPETYAIPTSYSASARTLIALVHWTSSGGDYLSPEPTLNGAAMADDLGSGYSDNSRYTGLGIYRAQFTGENPTIVIDERDSRMHTYLSTWTFDGAVALIDSDGSDVSLTSHSLTISAQAGGIVFGGVVSSAIDSYTGIDTVDFSSDTAPVISRIGHSVASGTTHTISGTRPTANRIRVGLASYAPA